MKKGNTVATSLSENIHINKSIRFTLLLIPGLFVFLFYSLTFKYHLFFKEQITLFIYSPEYLLSYFNKPGGLASLIGDFLTQFFYLKTVGPLLITLIFYINWVLFYKVINPYFRSEKNLIWYIFIFPFAESLMHYHIGYTLTHSLSLILTLLIFIISRRILSSKQKQFLFPLFILFGYLISGGMIALYFVFQVLDFLRQKNIHYISNILATAIAIFIPVILRSFFLVTIEEAYLYPFNKLVYLLPSTLTLIYIIPVLIWPDKMISLRSAVIVSSFILIIAIWKDRPDLNREKLLSLSCEGYFGNWDKVLQLSTEYKLENQLASYYANIALAKYNALPAHLLEYYQPFAESLFLPLGRQSGWLNIFSSNEAYYQIGDMNLTQHSAQLGLIFSPYNRSSRMVKRLAETNMIIGEDAAALKYLGMLDKTLFHHQWAQKRIGMIHNPQLMSKELIEKQSFLPPSDTLRKGEDNLSGLRLLANSNPDNQSAIDYILCYHLLNKDLRSFKEDFERYFTFNRQLPRLYGEALLIILYQQKASTEEISHFFLPSSLMSEFIEYTEAYSKSNGQLSNLSTHYRYTYWFYYHFAKKSKE
nr:DUF6057 family protein [uncultured Carboxylicivirga sp.]